MKTTTNSQSIKTIYKSLYISALFALFVITASFNHPTHELKANDNPEDVNHRIQLCVYTESVPVDEVELMREIGGVSSWKEGDKRIYLTSPYQSEFDASKDLPKFKSLGFEKAEQIVQIDNELLELEDYHKSYNVTPSSEDNSKPPVIRIWK